MKNLKWAGNASVISKMSGDNSFDEIPAGVWKLVITMSGAFLTKICDRFEFGHKVYGLESQFINHALTSFSASEKNMGVLLNGLKGCGKTVTAKTLANMSGLPVILVDGDTINNLGFFEDIQQPLCFMFDEFEKIINHENMGAIAPLLSFVDGTATATKHLMLFTSNDTKISEFFIDRPGRIRYIKNYGSLSSEVVQEILDDKLLHKEFEKDILEWVAYFKFLTIDILTSIINEVNLHKVGPSVFKSFFNADNEKGTYNVNYKFTDPETGQSHIFENYYSIEGESPADHFRRLINGNREMYVSCIRVRYTPEGQIVEQIDNYAQQRGFDNDDYELDYSAKPGEFKLIFNKLEQERVSLMNTATAVESENSMSMSAESKFNEEARKHYGHLPYGFCSSDGKFMIKANKEYYVEAIYTARETYNRNSFAF